MHQKPKTKKYIEYHPDNDVVPIAICNNYNKFCAFECYVKIECSRNCAKSSIVVVVPMRQMHQTWKGGKKKPEIIEIIGKGGGV